MAAVAIAEQVPAYRTVPDAEGVASVADVSIVGDEEQVATKLRRLAEAGLTEFVGLPYGVAETFARTVKLLAGLRL